MSKNKIEVRVVTVWGYFCNNFFAVQFTHHTTHPFKVYPSQQAILEHFTTSKRNLYYLAIASPNLLSQSTTQPLATTTLFSVSLEQPLLDISYEWNQTLLWSFATTGFFHLEWFQGSSVLQHVSIFHSFLWSSNIPLHKCATNLFIHSPLAGHWVCLFTLFGNC